MKCTWLFQKDLKNEKTLTTAPSSYDCNFDDQTRCTWTEDSTDDGNWDIHKGSTDSSYTGPESDHTTGKGKIMNMLQEKVRL